MEQLGRYYTKDNFSKLLVNRMSGDNPGNVVELGVGGGALVRAAMTRWINASYYVADVDENSLSRIRMELPFVNSFHFDTIKENVSEKLNLLNGTVDIAICNPPYLKIKNEKSFDQAFEEVNLHGCKKLKQLTSDIIFLTKNLQLLKHSGELGIILPDSLITGIEYRNLRKCLVEQHNLKGIIQLPEKIFSKTEALTHILIIEKGTPIGEPATLFLADKEGQIVGETEVEKDALIDRMDFKFHNWHRRFYRGKKVKTLKCIDAEITRGHLTHKELRELKTSFVHTTTLVHEKANLSLRTSKISEAKYHTTKTGDILLSRVGTIGKASMVLKGQALISDCVYRIRVDKKHRMAVWNALISVKGQQWLHANSHGVCAKLLSKLDLLNFPIE